MGDRIRGKVAQLVDDRTLVINRGAEHGVRVGMRFAVLSPEVADVADPDTGERIGSVEVDKALVKVVRVGQRIAVARTFQIFTTGFASILDRGVRHETLRIEGATYREGLDEKDLRVRIGDPVVEARGEEFIDE